MEIVSTTAQTFMIFNYSLMLMSMLAFAGITKFFANTNTTRLVYARKDILYLFRFIALGISNFTLTNLIVNFDLDCTISIILFRLLDPNAAIIIPLQEQRLHCVFHHLTMKSRGQDVKDEVAKYRDKTLIGPILNFFYPTINKRYKTKYALQMWAVIKSTTWIPTIIPVLIALFTQQSVIEVCTNPGVVYSGVLTSLIGFIMLIVYTIKIIHVHDYYMFKYEYISSAIFTYIPGLFGSTMANITGNQVYSLITLISLAASILSGFFIPALYTIILLIKEHRESEKDSSRSLTEVEDVTSTFPSLQDDVSGVKPEVRSYLLKMARYRKVGSFWSSIEDFMIDRQLKPVEILRFLLWKRLNDLNKKDHVITYFSKFILIYKGFLLQTKPDDFVPIEEDLYKTIEAAIKEADNADVKIENLDLSFIDTIRINTENEILEMVQDYFCSEYYRNFLNRGSTVV